MANYDTNFRLMTMKQAQLRLTNKDENLVGLQKCINLECTLMMHV